MSRIGKQIISVPDKVEVKLESGQFTVKGPLGTLTRVFKPEIAIMIEGKEITLKPTVETVASRALWGTYGSHIQNMVEGVTKGFSKKLIIEGVGYKYNLAGDKVVLDLGLSHQVTIKIPEGLKVVIEKGNMTVSGYDKEVVGGFAAKIKSLKPVEPYKGKGIRYEGQLVLRKQGKKSST
ncbi:MAG: 50S ribosomal protein L6 [bacterium]